MQEQPPPPLDDIKAIQEVKERLKFFFSDANVRQDRFVRRLLTKSDGDTPHRVPIEALLRFHTIQRYTTKAEIVVLAAKELGDLLTLDEKETAVGRVTPFTNGMMDDNIPKSLYLKDLPIKEENADEKKKQYNVTVEEIRAVFAKYGEVALVKLKWVPMGGGGTSPDKKSKRMHPVGSAMVEFSDKESLDKAAQATLTTKNGDKVEPTDPVSFGDKIATVMLLSEYIEERKKEKETKGGGSAKKRGRGAEKTEEEDEEKPLPTFEFDWKPGCVIRIKGLNSECSREAILETIAKALGVDVEEVKARKIYADYSRGQTEGAIRFQEPADAIGEMVKQLSDGSLEFAGAKVAEAFLLEGDEEKKYWEDFIAFKNRQIKNREEDKRSKKKHRH